MTQRGFVMLWHGWKRGIFGHPTMPNNVFGRRLVSLMGRRQQQPRFMYFTRIRTAISISLLLFSAQVVAASFDCDDAAGNLQKMICSNADLSAADDRVTALYNEAAAHDPQAIRAQSAWVSEISKCDTADCLRDAYSRRIDMLQQSVSNPPAPVASDSDANASVSPSVAVSSEPSPNASTPAASSDAAAPAAVSAASDSMPLAVSTSDTGNNASQPEIVASDASEGTTTSVDQDGLGFWGWVKLILLAIGCILYWGFEKSCPKCRRLWGDRIVDAELIDQSQGYETVTRHDRHRDRDGKVYKTVDREEQIVVTYHTYAVQHQCPHCRHAWFTRKDTKS